MDATRYDVGMQRNRFVTRLSLHAFRCYPSARIETDGRPVVLTGPNGAGKTNVLEALSYLAPGRGLRRARLSDVTRRGTDDTWAVSVRIGGAGIDIDVGTGPAPAVNGAERRIVRIDGDSARTSALTTMLGVHWLTPQMDRLFADGAGERRRFLDRMVFGSDPEHARRIGAYERTMRERARLLRERRGEDAWLTALEQQMAANGVAIAAARRDLTARLAHAIQESASPFPRAVLAIAGTLENALDDTPAIDVEARFQDRLHENRPRDGEMGGAGEGPHRSDLVVHHGEKAMPAAQCSTGEQKALLIAIVLANARLEKRRRGGAPLLLLDEVAAHLDEDRRAALYEEIIALRTQAWLTGTDAALFAPLRERAQFLQVRDAIVTNEE